MKRVIALLLTLVLCISLCACGGGAKEPEPTPIPTPTPVPTPSPEELAAQYDAEMAAVIGSDDRAPLSAGKAVTYWVDLDGVGTYNKKYLTDKWIAESPDEAKYVIHCTESTSNVGFYIGSLGGNAYKRYVRVEIKNSVSGDTLYEERFAGGEPPESITDDSQRYGGYPDEEVIAQWIASALDACTAEAYSAALRDAAILLDYTNYSKEGLKQSLISAHGYAPDEADYAANYCEADWGEQAFEFAKKLLDSNDYTRSQLFEQLTVHRLYTEEEANAALDRLNVDWDVLTDKVLEEILEEDYYSEASLIDYLTTRKNFTVAEAKDAIASCNIDWNEQAMRCADDLLHGKYGFGYSPEMLVYWMTESLEMGGNAFTKEQAQYVADHIKTDWNEQAAKALANWVSYYEDGYWDESLYGPYSQETVIWCMTEIDGFTKEQVEYALTIVTLP